MTMIGWMLCGILIFTVVRASQAAPPFRPSCPARKPRAPLGSTLDAYIVTHTPSLVPCGGGANRGTLCVSLEAPLRRGGRLAPRAQCSCAWRGAQIWEEGIERLEHHLSVNPLFME